MRFGLDDKYLDELTAILRSIPEIEEAVIYGSRARGDYRRASDIDLSLRGPRLEDRHVVWLKTLLYESRIPYFFDVAIPNSSPTSSATESSAIGAKRKTDCMSAHGMTKK